MFDIILVGMLYWARDIGDEVLVYEARFDQAAVADP
jgi:hypothetical protein